MKTLLIYLSLFTTPLWAAALVGTMPTTIEVTGMIGEKGVLKTRPYRLSASLCDKAQVFPKNKEQLCTLSVTIGKVHLRLSPQMFNKFEGVHIRGVKLFYIKQFQEDDTIEIHIPFGRIIACQNPEQHTQRKRILHFQEDGVFIRAETKECKLTV